MQIASPPKKMQTFNVIGMQQQYQNKHATTCKDGLKLKWTTLKRAQISGQSYELEA